MKSYKTIYLGSLHRKKSHTTKLVMCIIQCILLDQCDCWRFLPFLTVFQFVKDKSAQYTSFCTCYSWETNHTYYTYIVWTHRTHTWRLCETFAQTNTHYVYIQYGPIVPIHWDFCYSWETNTLCIHTVWTHCTHTLRLMRQQVLRWIYHTTLQRKRQETWKIDCIL